MRFAARIAKLEKAMPKPIPGCDVCRGRLVFGLGQFKREEVDGRADCCCASCGRALSGVKLIDIDLESLG